MKNKFCMKKFEKKRKSCTFREKKNHKREILRKIHQTKIYFCFSLIAFVLLSLSSFMSCKKKIDSNDAKNLAVRLIKAIEDKNYEYIFKNLIDKKRLSLILKENRGTIDDLIVHASKNPYSKEFISGLKKCIKNPPKIEDHTLKNGRVRKLFIFREKKGKIDYGSDDEDGSSINSFFIKLIQRSNKIYVFEFGIEKIPLPVKIIKKK